MEKNITKVVREKFQVQLTTFFAVLLRLKILNPDVNIAQHLNSFLVLDSNINHTI